MLSKVTVLTYSLAVRSLTLVWCLTPIAFSHFLSQQEANFQQKALQTHSTSLLSTDKI